MAGYVLPGGLGMAARAIWGLPAARAVTMAPGGVGAAERRRAVAEGLPQHLEPRRMVIRQRAGVTRREPLPARVLRPQLDGPQPALDGVTGTRADVMHGGRPRQHRGPRRRGPRRGPAG